MTFSLDSDRTKQTLGQFLEILTDVAYACRF